MTHYTYTSHHSSEIHITSFRNLLQLYWASTDPLASVTMAQSPTYDLSNVQNVNQELKILEDSNKHYEFQLFLTQNVQTLTDNVIKDGTVSSQLQEEIDKFHTKIQHNNDQIELLKNAKKEEEDLTNRYAGKILIPKDTEYLVEYDEVAVEKALKTMSINTHRTFTTFFNKLFRYGSRRDFSHQNYRDIMDQLFDGQAHTELERIKDRPLDKIVQFFVAAYDPDHETPADIQAQIDSFYRKANEPIRATMVRLETLLYQASKVFPQDQRQAYIETGLREKLTRLVGDKTKAKLLKEIRVKAKKGQYATSEELKTMAKELELEYSELPTHDVHFPDSPHTHTLALHQINECQIQALENDPEQQPENNIEVHALDTKDTPYPNRNRPGGPDRSHQHKPGSSTRLSRRDAPYPQYHRSEQHNKPYYQRSSFSNSPNRRPYPAHKSYIPIPGNRPPQPSSTAQSLTTREENLQRKEKYLDDKAKELVNKHKEFIEQKLEFLSLKNNEPSNKAKDQPSSRNPTPVPEEEFDQTFWDAFEKADPMPQSPKPVQSSPDRHQERRFKPTAKGIAYFNRMANSGRPIRGLTVPVDYEEVGPMRCYKCGGTPKPGKPEQLNYVSDHWTGQCKIYKTYFNFPCSICKTHSVTAFHPEKECLRLTKNG